MIFKMGLLILLGKFICKSVCLDASLYLLDKFAEGKDIKESREVFVFFCSDHVYKVN